MKPINTYHITLKYEAVFSAFVILIILGFWQFKGQESQTIQMYLSTPEKIIEYVSENKQIVLDSFFRTGSESVAGLVVAVFVSVILLVIFFVFPTLLALIYPWVVASQVIPFVVIAPLVIVVFGPEAISGKIAMTSLITFFPVLGNLVAALRNLPHEELEVMTLLNAGKIRILHHVVYPNCLNYFYSGLRVAAPISVIGAVLAEFSGADIGIGRDIAIAGRNLNSEKLMIGVLSSILMSSLIYFAIKLIEHCHGKWYKSGA